MKKRPATFQLLVATLASVVMTACLGNPAQKDADATRALLTSNGSQCGPNAFRQVVHPQLRANCAQCHAGAGPGVGSFAAYDVGIAYGNARNRVELNAPAASYLVANSGVSGHGNGCTACGAAWGASLTALIAEWGKAEGGDTITCANYQVAAGSDNPGAGPFDLGPYSPPRPEDTVVIPEGLAIYGGTGGLHGILRNNCAQCHIPGGLASFAPFAVADATASYREAKPRVNFGLVDLSLVLARASTPGHGSGCTICGDATFVTLVRNQIVNWGTQESQAIDNNRVKLISKSIQPLPGGTTDRIITWDLANETVPPQPALAGSSFSLRIRMSSTGSTTYRISDPRIMTGPAVKVEELSFILNDVVNSSVTTYHLVDATVPAGQGGGQSLAGTTPALLPSADTATDVIGISFKVLKAP